MAAPSSKKSPECDGPVRWNAGASSARRSPAASIASSRSARQEQVDQDERDVELEILGGAHRLEHSPDWPQPKLSTSPSAGTGLKSPQVSRSSAARPGAGLGRAMA